MARRRRKRKEKIIIDPSFQSKKGGFGVKADKSIHFDFGTTPMRQMMETSVEILQSAIHKSRSKPTEATIKRRGPGAFWNVTGYFVNNISFEETFHGWVVKWPQGRIERIGQLTEIRRRIGMFRPKRLWNRLRKIEGEKYMKRMIEKKRPKSRIGGV